METGPIFALVVALGRTRTLPQQDLERRTWVTVKPTAIVRTFRLARLANARCRPTLAPAADGVGVAGNRVPVPLRVDPSLPPIRGVRSAEAAAADEEAGNAVAEETPTDRCRVLLRRPGISTDFKD